MHPLRRAGDGMPRTVPDMTARPRVWVCTACGKISKQRDRGTEGNGWDVSCMLNAVECWADNS